MQKFKSYLLILVLVVLLFLSNGVVFAREKSSETTNVGLLISAPEFPKSPEFSIQINSSYTAKIIGNATKSGKVTLHIFSENYNLFQEVLVDESGDWVFETDVLSPGFYYANAYVVDIFGQKSETSSSKSFQVIINSPDFIFSIDEFNQVIYTGFFGLPNENIRIVLAREDGERIAYNTLADRKGDWVFVTDVLEAGKYTTSAQIFINDGQIKSPFSIERYFAITELTEKKNLREKIILGLISTVTATKNIIGKMSDTAKNIGAKIVELVNEFIRVIFENYMISAAIFMTISLIALIIVLVRLLIIIG